MKDINQYILEKFKISSKNIKDQLDNIDYSDEENIPKELLDKPFPDNIKKRFTKDKKELLWYKLWKFLAINGVTEQDDQNIKDYIPLINKLVKENIIIKRKQIRKYENGGLTIRFGKFIEAQPISKWKL